MLLFFKSTTFIILRIFNRTENIANGSGWNKKNAGLNTLLYYIGEQAPLTSCTATALVQCSFADTALGTLGIAHGAAGAAAPLAGGIYAVFAFIGTTTGAGASSGARVVGVHFKQSWSRRSKARGEEALNAGAA